MVRLVCKVTARPPCAVLGRRVLHGPLESVRPPAEEAPFGQHTPRMGGPTATPPGFGFRRNGHPGVLRFRLDGRYLDPRRCHRNHTGLAVLAARNELIRHPGLSLLGGWPHQNCEVDL